MWSQTVERFKSNNPKVGIGEVCKLFGFSRQAYYKHKNYLIKEILNTTIVLESVRLVRKKKPRVGVRKLYIELKDKFIAQGINIGRDSLFKLLQENGMLIRRRKRKAVTTMSWHWFRKYPNLIKDFNPLLPNRLWVSDITYIETELGFIYLFLLTDAYSRKIVGWYLSENLQAKNAIYALKMALNNNNQSEEGLIHHSDRGIQYCCTDYVKLLEKYGISISMTENGDPRENPIAERVNGILKDEWLNDLRFKDYKDAYKQLKEIIFLYNNDRLHSSIDMMTPVEAHLQKGELKKHWKSYFKKKEQYAEVIL